MVCTLQCTVAETTKRRTKRRKYDTSKKCMSICMYSVALQCTYNTYPRWRILLGLLYLCIVLWMVWVHSTYIFDSIYRFSTFFKFFYIMLWQDRKCNGACLCNIFSADMQSLISKFRRSNNKSLKSEIPKNLTARWDQSQLLINIDNLLKLLIQLKS